MRKLLLAVAVFAGTIGISPARADTVGAVATALHKARAKLETLLTEAVKGD